VKTNHTFSHRIGKTLRRTWQGWLRLEQRLATKLAAKGWPTALAKFIHLPILLMILLLGLMAIKVLALIFLITTGLFILANSKSSQEEPPADEWKLGVGGFGLYRGDIRVDPGDPPYEE